MKIIENNSSVKIDLKNNDTLIVNGPKEEELVIKVRNGAFFINSINYEEILNFEIEKEEIAKMEEMIDEK